MATTPYSVTGFVWDFISVAGSGTDMTFKSEATAPGTYLVSGSTYFSGCLTFQPSCVIKFEPGAYLLTYGSIYCAGSPGSPSILTAKRDTRFGEYLPDQCPPAPGEYSASVGLWDYYICGSLTIHGMRICYADTAVRLDWNPEYCPGLQHRFDNTTIEFCRYVYAGSSTQPIVSVQNSKTVDVEYPVDDFTECQSLAKHIIAGTQALAVGRDPNNWGRQIFWAANGPINDNCWINQVPGFNAISATPYQGPCTLVTEHYALAAWHMGGNDYVGRTYTFVGRDNQVSTAVCIGVRQVGTDIAVLALAPPPPPNVDRVEILPHSAVEKMPLLHKHLTWSQLQLWECTGRRVPAITVTQDFTRKTRAMDVCEFYDLQWPPVAHLVAQGDNYGPWFMPCWSLPEWDDWLLGGDSGHPIWFLINGELVYICTFWSAWEGSWPGGLESEVNNAITNLSSSLSLPCEPLNTADLDGFPDLN